MGGLAGPGNAGAGAVQSLKFTQLVPEPKCVLLCCSRFACSVLLACLHGYLGKVYGILLAAVCLHDSTPKLIPLVSESALSSCRSCRRAWEAPSALVMRESALSNRLNSVSSACARLFLFADGT